MSFSPIVRVRKLIDKMKIERDSPRLRRFISRSSSGSSPSEEGAQISRLDSIDWSVDKFKFECYPTENFIQVLPVEAVLLVFSFLEVKDLNNVRLVNKEWLDYADDNNIWKRLCFYDWNVHTLLEEDWKSTYIRLAALFSDGNWEGMSKWVEPEGFGNEQATTARLQFHKRSTNRQVKHASPSTIHRVDSSPNGLDLLEPSTKIPNFKESEFRIIGSGVTINCASHSIFKIEGERIETDTSGATFRWYKQFEKHTSVYLGKVDYLTGTVSGTIDYYDGTTQWKGIFAYTKSNRKTSKMEYSRLA